MNLVIVVVEMKIIVLVEMDIVVVVVSNLTSLGAYSVINGMSRRAC